MGHSIAAQWIINGRITSQEGKPITQAEIFFPNFNKIILSDDLGIFHFNINDSIDRIKIIITHIAYQRNDFLIVKKNSPQDIKFVLVSREILLEKIEISETDRQVSRDGSKSNQVKCQISSCHAFCLWRF